MMTTLSVSCQGKGKDLMQVKGKKAFEIVELEFLWYSKRVFILVSIHFKAQDRTNFLNYQFTLNKELLIPSRWIKWINLGKRLEEGNKFIELHEVAMVKKKG